MRGKPEDSGLLYRGSWPLGDSISVRYAIRFCRTTNVEVAEVEVDDVFIYLDDCRNILTVYMDIEGQESERLFHKIWQASVEDELLQYCPLQDFVYQVALLDGEDRRGGGELLFRGILRTVAKAMLPPNHAMPPESQLVTFSEAKFRHAASRDDNETLGSWGVRKHQRHRQSADRDGADKSTDRLKADFEETADIKEECGDFKADRKNCDLMDGTNSEVDDPADWPTDEGCDSRSDPQSPVSRKLKPRKRRGCPMSTKKARKYANGSAKEIVSEKPFLKRKTTARTTWRECRECKIMLSDARKEYEHYAEKHPDSEHRPSLPNHSHQKDTELKILENNGNREVAATCRECGKQFATVKHLYNHCKREHPDRPASWPSEPVRLGPISTLHERQQIYGKSGQEFRCGLQGCNLLFERYLSLVDHERTGHPAAFLCILCGLACWSADCLIAHSDRQHPRTATYICRVCGFFNRSNRGLLLHTQQEHLKGSLVYQCEKCSYTSENYVTFGHHKRTAHREEKSKFVCDECGNNFATKQSLASHKRLHNPDFKRFSCEYCPQRFGHSSMLLIHMRVHTGEKPFVCNICGAAFGSQTANIRHRRIVHAGEDEMAFHCQDCGKRYPARAKRDFENHCKTHTGVRDHVCAACGSAYFSSKGLRKHERSTHPEIKPAKPKPFKLNNGENVGVVSANQERGGQSSAHRETAVAALHEYDRHQQHLVVDQQQLEMNAQLAYAAAVTRTNNVGASQQFFNR